MMTRTLKGDEYASSHTKYRSRRVTSRRWSERLFIASPSLSVPCLSVWSVHRLPDDRVPLNRLLIPLTPWKDSSGIRWRRRRRWWSDPDRSWASVQWFLLNVGKACNFISNVFIIPYFCFVFAGLKFKLGLLNQHHFLSALSSFVGLMWTKDENTKNRGVEGWRERKRERWVGNDTKKPDPLGGGQPLASGSRWRMDIDAISSAVQLLLLLPRCWSVLVFILQPPSERGCKSIHWTMACCFDRG